MKTTGRMPSRRRLHSHIAITSDQGLLKCAKSSRPCPCDCREQLWQILGQRQKHRIKVVRIRPLMLLMLAANSEFEHLLYLRSVQLHQRLVRSARCTTPRLLLGNGTVSCRWPLLDLYTSHLAGCPRGQNSPDDAPHKCFDTPDLLLGAM